MVMEKITKNSYGHMLNSYGILQLNIFSCTTCSQENLIMRPLSKKLEWISHIFITDFHLSYGLFKYFAVLIDASTRYSHVFLSSNRNWLACARLLAQLIQLIAHLDYPMLVSSHLMLSMNIVCLLELMLNIIKYMFIHEVD